MQVSNYWLVFFVVSNILWIFIGFGWKFTLYCLALLILSCIICAFLYRPLPLPEEQLTKLNEELKQQALFAALSRAEGENSEDAGSVKLF